MLKVKFISEVSVISLYKEYIKTIFLNEYNIKI